MNFISKVWLSCCSLALIVVIGTACSSDGTTSTAEDETTSDTTTDGSTTTNETTFQNVAFTCDEIATKFVTRGSANADLAQPEVSATCVNDTVTVTSNGIPDFPYIETSPGVPEANIVDYVFPATPTPADNFTAIPIVGEIGVALNGIPIYGPTEGPGGDVQARPGGFTECGGHNGPTGYHYHIFDVTGSDYCLFSETDVTPAPVLFGYALDGYPIFSGNTQFTSSWYLSDADLFATDTWSAHTYSAGSGDLDQCNGRTDEDGNYAYYTTEGFPYIMGCFRGEVSLQNAGNTAMVDSPNIQTPSPVLFLADNLNEPDRLGWCIDTVGLGFSERLHAHSCKPEGGDVQFSYNAENQFIYSVAFDGKCMSIGGDGMSAEFDLLDCDSAASEQKFEFDIDTGFITPISTPELCVAVSESIRSAGPFSSRDLMLANCESFLATHLSWAIK